MVAGMLWFAASRGQVAVLPWAAGVVVLLALVDAGEVALARVGTDAYHRFMRKLPLNGGNGVKAEEFLLPAPQLGWCDAGHLLRALASLSVWPFYGALLAFVIAFHVQTSPPRPAGVAAKAGGCCSPSTATVAAVKSTAPAKAGGCCSPASPAAGGGCGKAGGCGSGGCGASAGKACGCSSGTATRAATPANARAGLPGGTGTQTVYRVAQPANGVTPVPNRAGQLPNPSAQPAGTASQPGSIPPIPPLNPAPVQPAVVAPLPPSVPIPPTNTPPQEAPPDKQPPGN